MVTNKQIVECLDILIRRVQTINDRTKKHTKEIKELRKQLKQIKN